MKIVLGFLQDMGKKNFKKFIKFGIVGFVGTIINFCVYYFAYTEFKVSLNLSSIVAFCFAVTNNYLLNHAWTFRSADRNMSISVKTFFIYILVNLKGLGINLLVLNGIIFLWGVKFHVLGQLAGIGLGMVSNFIYAKKVVFR